MPAIVRRLLLFAVAPIAMAAINSRLLLRRPQWAGLAEAMLICTVLCVLSFLPSFNKLWQRLPAPHRLLLASIAFAMIWGHITPRDRVHFPLINWTMYCSPGPNEIVYVDLVGFTNNNDLVDLSAADLFSPSRNGIKNRLMWLLDELESGKRASDDEDLRALCAAFLRQFNRLHPQDPIVSVELRKVRTSVDRSDPTIVISYP